MSQKLYDKSPELSQDPSCKATRTM